MRNVIMTVFLLASLFGFSGSLLAQIVHTPPDQKQLIIQTARQQLASLPTPVQVHFTNALKDSEQALPAARVLLDMVQQKIENTPDFVYYRVPALSNLQRLPLVYPVDGKIQSAVRSVIAKDEYESCSFEIYPFKDMVLVFTVNDLKNQKQEVLSADKLDLKVVKVWYQNKNAWYSYFSDVGLTLVPELLLKDENLILCKDQSNYARVNRNGKTEYLWINPPHEIDSSYTEISYKHYSSFRFMRENFSDAETLQPVSFTAGNFKQMWLTVHIPQDQPEGLYKGSITVKNHETGKVMQEIPLEIKILPYVLPQPLAPDMQRDFLVSLYGGPSIGRLLSLNGANRKLAVEQNLKILKNMRAHNLKNPMVENDDFPTLSLHFDQMKEAGMDMKTIIGTNWVFPWEKDKTGNYTQRMYDNGRKDAKAKAKFFKEKLGHTNVYLMMGDEPGASELYGFSKYIDMYLNEGLHGFCAGHEGMYNRGAYIYDMLPLAKIPEEAGDLKKPLSIGNYTGFYAIQHNGSENPDFVRRQHGIASYQAGHSCIINYEFGWGPWNDLAYDLYKPMVLAYPSQNGLVDTLAWEGFREAVDDIRYFTLLMTEVQRCKQSPNLATRQKAAQVLMWWADQKSTEVNLETLRMEIINYVAQLRAMN